MLVISLLAVLFAAGQAGRVVSFEREVKPLLEARCVKCHGAAMKLGKLDLRNREAALRGGEKGPGMVAGNAAQSILFKRVAGLEKPAMPMDGKLTDGEVETLRLWIDQGAVWEGEIGAQKAAVDPMKAMEEAPLPANAKEWWSFRKPVKADVPRVADARWGKHPVDAFVKRQLDAQGLKAAPEADRRTLVRRAYLDLTGLPPTPAEVREFVEDRRPDAWEQLVDRLLASPHYGERWGRHWLDVARYADSNGYEHDFDRPNAWRYRDYVIRAFNRDTPYDRFLLEQLAGDEVEEVNYETLTATGFLRNYAKVGFREKDNPQFRFEYLDDMIATLGRGVMGLTVHCARCHNHKFDPILQRDYYQLQTSLYGYVEVEHPLVPKEQAEEYYRQNAEIDGKIKPLRARVAEIEDPYKLVLVKDKYKRFPANVQEAIAIPEEQRTPGQALLANQIIRTVRVSSGEVARHLKAEERAEVQKLGAEIAALEKQRPKAIPTAMGITDGDYRFVPDGPGDEPAPGKGVKMEVTEGSYLHRGPGKYQVPPSYFLHGGDIGSRGSAMKPGFVSVVTEGSPAVERAPAHGKTSGRRRALAEWLSSAEHPLTARVMVNRIWHHHFGRGIVATLDNFGKTGEKPTHAELLDWLAVEFRERGWSFKAMHRLIMMSETYRMSSSFVDEGNLAKDAANLNLWRYRQQRLEAEVLRDSILHVAGSLNTLMEGPAVFPPLPEETLRSMNKGIWKRQKNGPETWRRSIYVYRKRGLPFPFFEVFDLPDQTITCGRRTVSTVATQALTLLNNDFVLDQSKRFAERLQAMSADKNEQLRLAYELALGRHPNAEEQAVAAEFLKTNRVEDLTHVLLNLSEFLYMR
ncbi:MAG: PSD1 domain-containing protein [Bryobacterales bacterium]|nr:PSD1 domain-containing protein [Bryobacterales bacterium]